MLVQDAHDQNLVRPFNVEHQPGKAGRGQYPQTLDVQQQSESRRTGGRELRRPAEGRLKRLYECIQSLGVVFGAVIQDAVDVFVRFCPYDDPFHFVRAPR